MPYQNQFSFLCVFWAGSTNSRRKHLLDHHFDKWKLSEFHRNLLLKKIKVTIFRQHCLDVTTQPKEPESFLAMYANIHINIDHFLCLTIICSHFISKKKRKIRVFSKFTRNPEQKKYLSYKYFYSILLIIKKPGHI